MPHAAIHVDIEDVADERFARVDGALDVFSSPMLTSRALASLPETSRSLFIDLRDVSFVDSAGVSALVKLRREATARGVDVRACIGDAESRIHATMVDVLRRVLPCDD
jgi:anti-anti-sigma factor